MNLERTLSLRNALVALALCVVAILLARHYDGDRGPSASDPKMGKVYLNSDGTPKGSNNGSFFKFCEWRNLVYNNGGDIAVSQFDPQCEPAGAS